MELTSGHQRAVLPLTKFVGAALYSSDHTLWQLSSQSLESSTSWTAAHPFHRRQQKHNSETENWFRCQCECVQQYTKVKKKKGRLRRSELNRKSDRPGPLLFYFSSHSNSEEFKQRWPWEQVSKHTFQSEDTLREQDFQCPSHHKIGKGPN